MKPRLLLLASVALAVHSAIALAQVPIQSPGADFTVGDIKVEGLQRISEGTVFNYLPVNIGDHLTPQRVREAVRALYATGFFRDVELRRQGNTLVVVVLERPSIESFTITGNKDIKTEDLQKSLRNVGLAPGKVFDRSVLEDVTQYLTDQYYSRGKYGVGIDTKVTPDSGNRVKIAIKIREGDRAVIRSINIVGDTRFKQKQILQTFQLKTPNWLSWYRQDDRYSRETLQGDLERLRDYYMDRGYANFQINATQVQITPEKNDIFIDVDITQGEVYKISEVKLAGIFVVPKPELQQLVEIHPGETFNRKLITSTQKLIQDRLGEDGYAFAKVDPVPTPDDKNHTVSLTFFIDPGNRVYVRNITFSGETAINDVVLRRELRQLEGGWLSNVALERSKQRIQKLPYVKDVSYTTTPVTASPDQVDVDYKIKQGPAAQLSGGIGYSATYKLMLNANYADADFLGTGNRFAVDLEGGAYNKVYTVQYTNPYLTMNGVGQTLSVSYRDVTQFVSSSSNFSSKTLSLGPTWSYPISEFQYLTFGAAFESSQLLTTSFSSAQQAQEWVQQNGNHYSRLVHEDYSNNAFELYGTDFKDVLVVAGWGLDTRNRSLFADRGNRTAINYRITAPGSSVKYWMANFMFQQYVPIWGHWLTLSLMEDVDYGAPLGKTTAIPPYQQLFGGGPDSVRGFREDWLGPRDNFGNPYGGNFRVTSQNEIILPMPEKWRENARVSLFFDVGNVFYSGNKIQFYGPDGVTPATYHFNGWNSLKRSTGLAVEWLAPLGLFRFSFGVPLNSKHGTITTWGDQTEGFQFSIGQAF
ncbi:MAG TPA: outer membrane protein assembly factor BamA [Steroidobacteraceae bacterium]|jgi:outer membrane protein insertion porin family|nr:outer membrane protein assembly factor BamA [Steroidobacteraceae bacterium]